MTIVDIIEKVFDVELLEWQKDYIIKYYDAIKAGETVHCIIPRGGPSKFSLRTLQTAVLFAYALEIKDKEG